MTSDRANSSGAPGLGHRSAVAFSWGVFASVAKVVLTVFVQAVLARLLGPQEFGLFALGILVMGIAGYFSDAGLATSLVQQQQVHDGDVRFVLTLNLLTAALVGALLIVFAGPIALGFGKPEARPIFCWLAPVFVLNALASVSTSLLRRKLDYRSIQLANLAGYALGFGLVGIVAAVLFRSVYALVAAYCFQALITLVLLYRKTRHSIGLSLRAADRSAFIGFGANILVTNLVNWAAGSLDRLIVGRLFSSATLGHYSASYNLVHSPVIALYANLQSTVFSSMARMQDEIPRMRNAYMELLRAVTIVFLPIFVGLYFFSGPLVLAVYGLQWDEAARLAGPFCLIAPFVMIWACSTPVLWNSGRRAIEWQLQLPFLGLAVLIIVPAADVSVLAVAWAATLIYVARSLLMMGLALRALEISAGEAWSALWPSIWISALVGLTAMFSAWQMQGSVLPMVAQVILGAGVVVGILVLCLLLVPSVLPVMVRRYIGGLTPVAPSILQPLLTRLNGNP